MSVWTGLIARGRGLFHRRRLEREMAEEMAHHLALRAERNLAQGLSPEEAHAQALRQFGNVPALQERSRDQRGWRWLDDFCQDFRHGARLLRKSPGFTVTAVAVLSLGLGANSAVFNLVHSLLLAPTTYARPAEVRRVLSQDQRNPDRTRDFSYPAYQEIRRSSTIFSGTLASALTVVGVGEKGNSRGSVAALVSSNYFSVLGVGPAQGRAFLPEEETPDRRASVVIVSHQYWARNGLDPALLGSSVQINGRAYTVVGIMPQGFTGTTALFFTEFWLPLGAYDQVMNKGSAEHPGLLADQTTPSLMILGRLKPGLTTAEAEAAIKALTIHLNEAFPVGQKGQRIIIEPPSRFASLSNDTMVAWIGVLLLGMAAVVLLVACLNVANMLLARGAARRKEMALRLALGGGRTRIVRQLLTESFLLALLGGVGGLVLAGWSSSALVDSLGRMIPLDLVWTARPQPAQLAATFGFCVLGTLAFALVPALKLSRGEIMAHLKEQAGEDVVRRRWKFLPRNPLVSVQIALSLALLTAAGLFIRGAAIASAGAGDTGLKPDRVFLVDVDASLGGHSEKEARDLYRRLRERFAALPGVESASLAIDIPMSDLDFERGVRRLGGAGEVNSVTSAKWNAVGEDYFPTTGLPLLRGRAFSVAETTQSGGPAVAIIDEVLADRLWPHGDPLGQRLELVDRDAAVPANKNGAANSGSAGPSAGNTCEVVGVTRATRHNLFEMQPEPSLYLPFARGFQSHVFFLVKFAALPPGSEALAADLVRRNIRETDPTIPILSLETFAQHLNDNIQIWIVRAGAALFATFGGLALCLAVTGVYGVMAYSVSRRTREIGIRMALGARAGAVQKMILREGGVMLASGLAMGFLLALGIGKIVSSLLYRVDGLDPIALTAAPALLATAGILACWLPARRATKVNPITALRAE